MQEEDRKTLQRNRQALVKDLEAKRVASLLYSREIFSIDDKDEVNAKATASEQRETVLDILPRKGPRAFRVFCDVLEEVSPHLEALLRPVQEDGRASEGIDGPSEKNPIPASVGPSEKNDHVDHPRAYGSYNVSPVPRQLDTSTMYRMNRSTRGIAVIINNKDFLESSGQHLSPRNGTDVDRDALKKLFKNLQFKVEVYNNQTKAEIRRIAEEKATFNHSIYDAFIFAILTHGEEGLVYGIDGTISIKDLTSRFKYSKSLAGKPKIFFLQACQENVHQASDEADAKLFSFGGGGSINKSSSNTADSETIYRMSHSTRGIAIIINNKNFLRSSGMDRYPRNGTDVDRDALAKMLRYLKFDVRIYNDQTKAEIRRITKEMATTNHSNYDAFIFSILTHGEEGVIYGTDGTMSIKDLTSIFKDCTTLVGKPKVFFFQACQGHEYMDGMDVTDAPQPGSKVSVPAEADFIYAYSTVPGYYSWRNSVNGSWFIQSLTKVFEENAGHMDILRMLTRVNALVSTYKSRTGDYYSDRKRQVSSIVSMLRKELYFFPENIAEQS